MRAGGEQVVRRGHRVEVAGEVQIDTIGGHELGAAAAGPAAFDAETRSERGLAQREARGLAEPGERVGEPDAGGRLALAGRGRGDGGHEDEPRGDATRPRTRQHRGRDLGDAPAVGDGVVGVEAEAIERQREPGGERDHDRGPPVNLAAW
jgi:hypothetical protein